MDFLKKNLDAGTLTLLSLYVLFLLFAVLDEQLGWNMVTELFY